MLSSQERNITRYNYLEADQESAVRKVMRLVGGHYIGGWSLYRLLIIIAIACWCINDNTKKQPHLVDIPTIPVIVLQVSCLRVRHSLPNRRVHFIDSHVLVIFIDSLSFSVFTWN